MDPQRKLTIIGLLILQLVQLALESLGRIKGVQVLGVPMSSCFEVSVDVRHLWGIIPQGEGMHEGMDGHLIHPGGGPG